MDTIFNNFQGNVVKLISNDIPRFDKHIYQIIADIKDPTKIWNF